MRCWLESWRAEIKGVGGTLTPTALAQAMRDVFHCSAWTRPSPLCSTVSFNPSQPCGRPPHRRPSSRRPATPSPPPPFSPPHHRHRSPCRPGRTRGSRCDRAPNDFVLPAPSRPPRSASDCPHPPQGTNKTCSLTDTPRCPHPHTCPLACACTLERPLGRSSGVCSSMRTCLW